MGTAQVMEAAPTLIMVISYWSYLAFLPALIVAFVVLGFVVPRKR